MNSGGVVGPSDVFGLLSVGMWTSATAFFDVWIKGKKKACKMLNALLIFFLTAGKLNEMMLACSEKILFQDRKVSSQ